MLSRKNTKKTTGSLIRISFLFLQSTLLKDDFTPVNTHRGGFFFSSERSFLNLSALFSRSRAWFSQGRLHDVSAVVALVLVASSPRVVRDLISTSVHQLVVVGQLDEVPHRVTSRKRSVGVNAMEGLSRHS